MNTLYRRRTLYWAPAGGLAPALICHPFPAMRVPALHQFDYCAYTSFAKSLREEIKGLGLWSHVIDAHATTISRWDGTHDGIHYLWHAGLAGDLMDELKRKSLVYETEYRGTRLQKTCCRNDQEAADLVKYARRYRDGCSQWLGPILVPQSTSFQMINTQYSPV